MDKIRVSSSSELTAQYPGCAQTRITIRGLDGSVHSHLQKQPRGHALNPLSDAELEEKFMRLYAAWGDSKAARRTLDLLWSVDKLDDSSHLVDGIFHLG